MKAGLGGYQINPPPRENGFGPPVFTSHADSSESHTRVLHNGSFSFPHTLSGIPESSVTTRNHTCGEDMEQLAERGAMASQVHQESTKNHAIFYDGKDL